MSWHDVVFAVGGVVFGVSLVPTIVKRQAPALMTSVPTSALLVVYVATYLTMRFWFSAAVTGAIAVCWVTMAVQRIRL